MFELVSIIVPIYNAEEFLVDCIQSLLNQTYQNIEIILIDDGSTDKSKKICHTFSSQDKRVKVYSINNSGVSNARNFGIEHALGKYIMFCDSDDMYSLKFVQSMLENLIEFDSELGICFYDRFTDNFKSIENNDNNTKGYDITNPNDYYNLILFNEKVSGYVWNKIFIKDIIIQNNLFFDINIHEVEDLYFVVKYLNYVKRVSVTNDVLYYYRDNPDSIMNQCFNYRKYTSLYGRNFIYNEVKGIPLNEDMKKKVWQTLIECCFGYTKSIIFSSSFKSKKVYLNEILTIYRLVKHDYKFNFFDSLKFNIKFLILNIFYI
ncbi:glycosyltransferase family 2 protein [Romboutsia ilealis]|uniref:glycosyltransferase family 2 protein n=1 Tax=Romboutsia ilealis TaxID=1115758 RepID=UPI002572F345|nr:glycosyltransferase family 2 protein [Romboutsia ilealis]